MHDDHFRALTSTSKSEAMPEVRYFLGTANFLRGEQMQKSRYECVEGGAREGWLHSVCVCVTEDLLNEA